MSRLFSILVGVFISSTGWTQSACVDIFEKKTLSWPADLSALDFEVLTDFMRAELNDLGLVRDSAIKAGRVKWEGQSKIQYLYVGQSDIPQRFSKTMLDYHKENDRDILDVSLMTLAHLGMDMAVKKIKDSSQMKAISEKTKLLQIKVQQKTITKDELKNELIEILKLVNSLVNDRSEILKGSAQLNANSVESVFKVISDYYKISAHNGQSELKIKLSALIEPSQEQGFRVWMGKNTITFGRIAERIQDYLEQQSTDKTELDVMDEIVAERIHSAVEIALMD